MKDYDDAKRLYDLLSPTFRVWFDKARLREGCKWHEEIEAGCEASRIFLPVLTPNWKRSEWTRYETYGAETIVPILRIEQDWDAVKTPPLERFQYHAISIGDPKRLIAAIKEELAKPPSDKYGRVHHLPAHANPNFVGREQSLLELHEKLFTNPATVLTQGKVEVVTALGGVGKTTLAREYAETFWRCYRQIFWVDCRLDFPDEFAKIHDLIRPELANAGLQTSDKAAWAIAELNQTNRPLRLLILDNAENQQSVLKWVPASGNCHTVITSRCTEWSPNFGQHPVWVLDPGSARELLLRRARKSLEDPEKDLADKLAEKLGYLPLALEQAAAYIAHDGSFKRYLRLYEENEARLQADWSRDWSTVDYPHSVFLTWRATIDALAAGSRAILRLCSFLSPADIPAEMLTKGAASIAAAAEEMGANLGNPGELDIDRWRRELALYSMIQWRSDKRMFSIHCLVQSVERNQVSAEAQPRIAERAADMLMAWAPREAWRFENWEAWRMARPHAQELYRVRAGSNPAFLLEFGTFLHSRGECLEAEPLLTAAVKASECMLGAEHPDTLDAVSTLAVLYWDQGRFGDAELLYRRAFKAQEQRLGTDHRETLQTLNNLAVLCGDQGRYAEAEVLNRRALGARKRAFGADHVDTLNSVHNLAMLYLKQGRLKDAEPLCRRALELREKVLGTEHPDTLQSVSTLADLYVAQRRYSEAEPLYRRALKARELVLGKEHPRTLDSVNCLGMLYWHQGRCEEAEPFLHRALESRRQVRGVDHPDTLASENNLALLYWSQERYGDAEPLYVRVLQSSEKVLGMEHPDTLGSINNLAMLYLSQERDEEAQLLCARAAALGEKLLGREHPDTQVFCRNLARVRARLQQKSTRVD